MTLRTVVGGVFAGALTAVGLRLLGGVETPWAVLLGLPIGALTMSFLVSPRGAEPFWTPLPGRAGGVTSHQASSLASRLAEAAEYPDRFRTRVQPRLRRLAVAKLRRAGVTGLADERAVEVLGPDLHRLVTDPTTTLPGPTTAAAMFGELEEP